MKLTQQVQQWLTETSQRQVRLQIALKLGVSESWLNRVLAGNKEDNLFTKASALVIIRKETGLADEQILEEQEVSA